MTTTSAAITIPFSPFTVPTVPGPGGRAIIPSHFPRPAPDGDLVVDTAELRAIAAGLRFLTAEFSRVAAVTGPGAATVGHPALGGALHAFAANWRHHRARIIAATGDLATAASRAALTYEQVDADLATRLRPAGRRSSGSGPPRPRVPDQRRTAAVAPTRRTGPAALGPTGRRR